MNSGNEQKEQWEKLYSGNPVQWRGESDIGWFNLDTGKKVLDLGCGNGKTSYQLSKSGFDVTGIDFQESAIEECKTRIQSGEFIVGDIRELPFSNDSFDAVVAIHQLEHLPENEVGLTVKEALRVLRLNGKLIIQQFGTNDFRQENKKESVRNGIRYRYYAENEIKSLLEGNKIELLETLKKKTKFGETRETIRCVAIKS